jgi:hypothetical protein
MKQLPHYVTRLETAHSAGSTDPYTAKGLVITGPNTGRYVIAKGTDRDQVHTDFLRMAADAYAAKGV